MADGIEGLIDKCAGDIKKYEEYVSEKNLKSLNKKHWKSATEAYLQFDSFVDKQNKTGELDEKTAAQWFMEFIAIHCDAHYPNLKVRDLFGKYKDKWTHQEIMEHALQYAKHVLGMDDKLIGELHGRILKNDDGLARTVDEIIKTAHIGQHAGEGAGQFGQHLQNRKYIELLHKPDYAMPGVIGGAIKKHKTFQKYTGGDGVLDVLLPYDQRTAGLVHAMIGGGLSKEGLKRYKLKEKETVYMSEEQAKAYKKAA